MHVKLSLRLKLTDSVVLKNKFDSTILEQCKQRERQTDRERERDRAEINPRVFLCKSYFVSQESRINPFMPNEISASYQLDESISFYRVVGWCFSFLFKF